MVAGKMENGGYCLTGAEFQFRKMKNFWRWMAVKEHSNVNAVNATDLYT